MTNRILLLLVPCFLFLSYDSIGQTGAWVYIDPISPQVKIIPAGIPSKIIIPVGGALLIGGGTTAFIISNPGSSSPNPQPIEPTPTPFEVNDDNYNVPCGQTSTINPLINDVGQGLVIDSLIGAPVGVALVSGNLIQLPGDLLDDYSFFIVVSDNLGNSSTSLIAVSIITPTFILANDFFTTNSGVTLTDNILNNDDCINCIVLNIVGGEGSINWDAQGNFNYNAPNNFDGIDSLTVSIANACGQTGTSILAIEVILLACNFSWPGFVETVPEICGTTSGAASPSADHIGNYNFSWSNGVIGTQNTDLEAGDYELFVFDPESGCTDTVSFVIEEIPYQFVIAVLPLIGSCGNLSDADIAINTDISNPVNIMIEGPSEAFISEWTESNLLLSSALPLLEGIYTITFSSPSSPQCTESVSVEIAMALNPSILITDQQNPGPPEYANGSVTLLIENFIFPVDIFLNGMFLITAFEPLLNLEGLLPGEYELSGIGSDGCISEAVFFFLLPEGMAPSSDFNKKNLSPGFSAINPITNQINGFTQSIFEGETQVTIVPVFYNNPLQIGCSLNDWFGTFDFNQINYSFINKNHVYSGRIDYLKGSIGKNITVLKKQLQVELGATRWQSTGSQKHATTGYFTNISYPISIGKKANASIDFQAAWVNQLIFSPGLTIRP